ncbi:hypothetical protein K488DRAFT_73623 [Vararia minispora EC-137]|uniref:Uncharacterized protein n=1 Tax=Vararia minispora EC-137 TaxID=1314806 RepID=A0ACB8QA00_9AGAM|nr:hypothetical protein K488DRAFT_73623 [Vararia minispora EC-137]
MSVLSENRRRSFEDSSTRSSHEVGSPVPHVTFNVREDVLVVNLGLLSGDGRLLLRVVLLTGSSLGQLCAALEGEGRRCGNGKSGYTDIKGGRRDSTVRQWAVKDIGTHTQPKVQVIALECAPPCPSHSFTTFYSNLYLSDVLMGPTSPTYRKRKYDEERRAPERHIPSVPWPFFTLPSLIPGPHSIPAASTSHAGHPALFAPLIRVFLPMHGPYKDFISSYTSRANHRVGSAKIGTDPSIAVVDSNVKVFNMDNLV